MPYLASKLFTVPVRIELDRTSRNDTGEAWAESSKETSPSFAISDRGQDLKGIADVVKRGVARGAMGSIEVSL